MKYIDADKLKVEVKRLQGYAKAYLYGSERQSELSPTQYRMEGAESFCLSILSFIDSLQQEQPSLPSNLDEAAKEYDEAESWSYEALPHPRRAAFKAGACFAVQRIISLIESRIAEILGDAQPAPVLRIELQELIDKIKEESK